MMTSNPRLAASVEGALRARHGIELAGRIVRLSPTAFAPTTFSCWMAAGRFTSVDTSSGCRPWPTRYFASFPAVVVLPAPCKPSRRMTRGRLLVGCRPPSASPKSASISSRTILTTCCDGDRLPSTSCPIARSRTRSTNALTTLKLTSASSSARRISRSAASMVSGVSLVSPRNVLKTSCRRVLRESNIVAVVVVCGFLYRPKLLYRKPLS